MNVMMYVCVYVVILDVYIKWMLWEVDNLVKKSKLQIYDYSWKEYYLLSNIW